MKVFHYYYYYLFLVMLVIIQVLSKQKSYRPCPEELTI